MSVDLTPLEPADQTGPDRLRLRLRQWVTIATLVLVLAGLTGWALEHFGAIQEPTGESLESDSLGLGVGHPGCPTHPLARIDRNDPHRSAVVTRRRTRTRRRVQRLGIVVRTVPRRGPDTCRDR